MSKHIIYAAQDTSNSNGNLSFNVTSSLGLIPIPNAKISISYSSEPDKVIEEINTNEIGRTIDLELPTPPIDYSLEPGSPQPYANYNIFVTADGYEPTNVFGTEVLPSVTALQPIKLSPIITSEQTNEVVILPHTLFYNYPPKIPEAEIKPINESGEIVLSRVVIPEIIIVHDGVPSDTSANNYYVPYSDYIKNVVSSEIYATWPEDTLYANTLAIMSFTLNRVYTEWYRNQGYSFTITNSTAYDQKWMYGRNYYENVEMVVDNIFNNFLSRPGVKQPILTSYCDGKNVTCGGLSQWGSKYLGDQGYTPIDIIHYYYGGDMYINSSIFVSGVPSSFPGYNLNIGASGDKVMQIQEQLNRIKQNYPLLPSISVDGIYGQHTANAVRIFQQVFNLSQTGIVDYATWYKISQIYVGVTRLAEPIS